MCASINPGMIKPGPSGCGSRRIRRTTPSFISTVPGNSTRFSTSTMRPDMRCTGTERNLRDAFAGGNSRLSTCQAAMGHQRWRPMHFDNLQPNLAQPLPRADDDDDDDDKPESE